jgi:hypothetical protein
MGATTVLVLPEGGGVVCSPIRGGDDSTPPRYPGAMRRYGSAKRMISLNAGAATSAP